MNTIYSKWDEILESVKKEHDLSEVSFKTWLKPLTIHKIENNTVTILVPSQQFALDYVSKKYSLPLKVAISEITGFDYDITFVLPEHIQNEKRQRPASSSADNEGFSNLNPKYTFDTFVIGNNNKFAHAAALAVAESPGEVYNPLFLYGGVGLGKTHLMHSIAHFFLKKNPSAKIMYVTSETFTNELIEAIRNGNNMAMTNFRDKYRNIDMLLIDDIQFIIGKESTQEEFFHTFNELRERDKQIVISSDRPPKDMEILEERIRSRLTWGLLADISAPDYETRVAILRKKEEMDGYELDNKIIEYIAENITSNIRDLEGSLNKIIAYANLEKREITMELAEKVLNDIISPNEKKLITPELIVNTVAEHFNIAPEEILGSKRSSKIVYPRQIAMYLCRDLTNVPYKLIGKYMGNRDHTTVMHGCEKIEQELSTSSSTQRVIEILKKKIQPPA